MSSSELVLGVAVGNPGQAGSAELRPLGDLIEAETGKRVEVVETRDESGLRRAAQAGQFDIGVYSAVSYLALEQAGAPIIALAAEVPAGSAAAEETSQAVVPGGSPVRTLAELSGKRVCVGPIGSIDSSLAPRYALRQAGASAELVRFESDAEIIAAVSAGARCDAGFVTAASSLQSGAGTLEVIATLSVPSRIVAMSTRLPADVRSAAARALAAATPSELAAGKIALPPEFTARLSGYLPVTSSYFDAVRQMCAVPELAEECPAS